MTEGRLSLGQIVADVKSDEITSIQLLLELLDVNALAVTIDALGCRKEISSKVVKKEGDHQLVFK